jgi:hypothetical protein
MERASQMKAPLLVIINRAHNSIEFAPKKRRISRCGWRAHGRRTTVIAVGAMLS